MPDPAVLAQSCRSLALLGGEVIQQFSGQKQIRSKGTRDWVTQVDLEVQRAIENRISQDYPESSMLGEEDVTETGGLKYVQAGGFDLTEFAYGLAPDSPPPDSNSPLLWIVDPIDGTNNFIHGFPFYAVSVAVAQGSRILAGAILDVCHHECYWTGWGQAAHCNDQVVQVGDCRSMSESMVVGSIPRLWEQYPDCHQIFQEVSGQCRSVRRLGSAALNLAYIASGKLDSYWALSLQIWDVAAGALLLKQAGGVQTIESDPRSGGLAYLGSCSVELQAEMSGIVNRQR